MNESEIEAILSGHEARNERLRVLLIEKGVNLDEARQIECHFWAWSQEDANALSDALRGRGFQILVKSPAASPDDPLLWNIEAAISQSVKMTVQQEFTEELARLAHSQGAEYDGWGTSV